MSCQTFLRRALPAAALVAATFAAGPGGRSVWADPQDDDAAAAPAPARKTSGGERGATAKARALPDLAGTIERVEGRRAFVRGEPVQRWAVGLPVVVAEPGEPGAGLVLAAGVVQSRAGDRAVVLLDEGAANLPRGCRVEPRFVAEARAYGAPMAIAGGPDGEGTAREPAAEARPIAQPQIWHEAPREAPWGGKLWLELVATADHAALVVRWRVGRSGAFADAPMVAGADGRWTAELAIGEPDPAVDELEYYIGATVTRPPAAGATTPQISHEVVVGHAATPIRVRISSGASSGRRAMVDHRPASRWTDHQALPITARIDKRFREPTLMVRARGGGSFDALPMVRVGGDVYRAVIPAERVVVPGISYYIAVTDGRGVARDGFASDSHPFNVHVTRGTVLSPEAARNRVTAGVTMVRYGGSDDAYTRTDIGLERMFFGFLVGRLGAEATLGRAPRRDPDALAAGAMAPQKLRLYGGTAGLEARLGDYVSLTTDMLMAIHSDGAGLGYALGARIGDEAGSHIVLDWRRVHDLDTGDSLVEQLRVALSVPVGRSLRLDGVVVHESVLTDASKGLRFAVEAGIPIGSRLWAVATAGFAGRDADSPGATGGLRLALVF